MAYSESDKDRSLHCPYTGLSRKDHSVKEKRPVLTLQFPSVECRYGSIKALGYPAYRTCAYLLTQDSQ